MVLLKDKDGLQKSIEQYQSARTKENLGEVCILAEPFIDAVTRRFSSCAHTRDDLRQETYLGLLKVAETYRGEAQFATTITSVAYNACIMHYRRENAKKRKSIQYDSEGMPEPTAPIVYQDKNEAHELATRLMQIIPPNHRELLELYYLYGLNLEELAKQEGKSVASIKTMLHRMRRNVYALAKRHNLAA